MQFEGKKMKLIFIVLDFNTQLLMKNIFIQLKSKVQLKQEPLLKMLDIDPEEDTVPPLIEEYF